VDTTATCRQSTTCGITNIAMCQHTMTLCNVLPCRTRQTYYRSSITQGRHTTPSESLSPPNIQEKSLSIIQEKAEFLKEKVITAAVVVQPFSTTIDPKEFPTLASKQICVQTDKEITPVLRDILKLAKKVKSSGVEDLLKVLHYNDTTTSLVEVPCSARQSCPLTPGDVFEFSKTDIGKPPKIPLQFAVN
jgi:hypothetical protein